MTATATDAQGASVTLEAPSAGPPRGVPEPTPSEPGRRVGVRRAGPTLGIGIVGLYIQDATGFRAGWVQLIFDAALFALAFLVLPWDRVLWSALGAAVLNLVIAINHRRDRYIV